MNKILAVLAISIATGCSTTKNWEGSGYSKEDGMVSFTYSHKLYQIPKIDKGDALIRAITTCKNWKYSGAEYFGERKGSGITTSGWTVGAYEASITHIYQCI